MMRGLEKRPLGRTGLKSTFVGFGALEIGRAWGLGDEGERRRPEDTEAGLVLNSVLDLGVNIIDTAAAYHRSEERIGAHLSGRRSEYVLAQLRGDQAIHRRESGEAPDRRHRPHADPLRPGPAEGPGDR